jgi:serine/threonine transporter
MSTQSIGLFARLAQGSLVKQILIGLVLGILLALVSKPAAEAGAARDPVRRRAESRRAGAGSDAGHGLDRQPPARTKNQHSPYSVPVSAGNLLAALTPWCSASFPSTLHLTSAAGDITPPSGIVEVLRGLLMSMVSNPITR